MIRIYCINLGRDTRRRQKMESVAAQYALVLEFVEAIEGSGIDYDMYEQYGYDRNARNRAFFDLEKNEIACLLSHKKALGRFLASDEKYCVVFEDDAAITEKFTTLVLQLTQCVTGWDLIKLECRTKQPRGYEIARMCSAYTIFAPIKGSFGATGILYTRDGAEKVLKSLKGFRHAFDTHLGFCWRYKIYVAEIFPSVVFESKDSQSSIGGRRGQKRRKGLLAWLLARKERMVHAVMKRLFALRTRSIIKVEQPAAPESNPAVLQNRR